MAHDDGRDGKAVTLGLSASFGFGDRIGLATPGHVQALRAAGVAIQPIFPQQSIREMQRTGRTPTDVMTDALTGMAQAGWDGPTGADADHLKTPEDVAVTTEAGFTLLHDRPLGRGRRARRPLRRGDACASVTRPCAIRSTGFPTTAGARSRCPET